MVHLLQPGLRDLALPPPDAASGVATTGFSLKEFIAHLVPSSIFDAMARNEILQIVVFSVFVGTAVAALDGKAPLLLTFCEQAAAVMLKITGYVMVMAPLVVFAALASTVATSGLSHHCRLCQIRRRLLSVAGAALDAADRRLRPGGRPADRRLAADHPRAVAAGLFHRHLRGRLSLSAGGPAEVRRAAQDRQLRAAAGLFVQSGRLDDVLHLRQPVHRPGLWHSSQPWPADRHAGAADDHLQGHRRGAARLAGGDRRHASRLSPARGRPAADPRRRSSARHGPQRHQCGGQFGGGGDRQQVGKAAASRPSPKLAAAPSDSRQ